MFKVGDRVIIVRGAPEYDKENGLAGRYGTIQRLRFGRPKKWFVEIDGDPGFPEQGGCWIITEKMMKLAIISNRFAANLLDKEW